MVWSATSSSPMHGPKAFSSWPTWYRMDGPGARDCTTCRSDAFAKTPKGFKTSRRALDFVGFWPFLKGIEAKSRYLCLLANPQNALSWLQNVPLLENAFRESAAEALYLKKLGISRVSKSLLLYNIYI